MAFNSIRHFNYFSYRVSASRNSHTDEMHKIIRNMHFINIAAISYHSFVTHTPGRMKMQHFMHSLGHVRALWYVAETKLQ